MSKASELEDKRIANELIAKRCRSIVAAHESTEDGKVVEAAITVVGEVARLLLAEATHIAEQRRKGWQTSSREYTAAGHILAGWAAELEEHAKPDVPYDKPNPHREPLTVEEMRAHPMASVTPIFGRMSTDDKLDAAFGPLNPVPLEDPTDTRWDDQVREVTERGGSFMRQADGRQELRNAGGELIDYRPRAPRNAPPSDPEFVAHLDGEVGFTPPQRVDKPEVMFVDPTAPTGVHAQQRMTFAQVREHGMARHRGADHRSHSQVTAYQECGVRYALDDLDQVPAWWNVGGTALHYACEALNDLAYYEEHASLSSPESIEHLWQREFGRAISEAVATPGAGSPNDWRAAKKGSEGYDWWRVEGAAMVGRWVDRLRRLYAEGWRIATIDGRPAIEISLPFTMTGIDRTDDLKIENIIDLIMTNDAGDFLIVDMKSSASMPDSTRQLGQYGWALNNALGTLTPDPSHIFGAYWMARDDGFIYANRGAEPPDDLRELHPWDEIEYLISTMDASERQGLYLPNKSKSDRFGCGSCPVRGLCPVGPR